MGAATLVRKTVFVLLALSLAASAADAASRRRVAARPAAPPEPTYDTSQEVTITGIIQEIRENIRPDRFAAQRVVLQTENGPMTIELGPSSFLKARDFALGLGDALELVGSVVRDGMRDGRLLLAREVRRGDDRVELRDREGRPLWVRAWNRLRSYVGSSN